MTGKKMFLIIQSALCLLTAILLAAAAIRIYLDGSAYQAAGHPSEWIYTRQKVLSALLPILPVILISLAVTVCGLLAGIKDGHADRPAADAYLRKSLRQLRSHKAGSAETLSGIPSEKADPDGRKVLARRILMAAAAVFIIMGVMNGSMKDVLVKAIKICTECIGLG